MWSNLKKKKKINQKNSNSRRYFFKYLVDGGCNRFRKLMQRYTRESIYSFSSAFLRLILFELHTQFVEGIYVFFDYLHTSY